MRQSFLAMPVALLAGLGALAGAGPAAAQSLCGGEYRVQAGDTLSRLAARAFGSASRFLEFYEIPANEGRLGTNPDYLRIGQIVALPPCPGRQVARVDTQTSRPSETVAGGPGFVPRIEIVTAGGYPPFTDPGAPGKGMLTQVVAAALDASGLPNGYDIDFVNDWDSHLNILIPKGKYDFGFPWFQPDCSDPMALPEDDRIRCDYAFSEVLFPIPIGMYAVDTGAPLPSDPAELLGATICKPTGYLIFDLAELGLTEPNITLVRPATPGECFTALERDEVDFVSLNRFTAEKAIAEAGLQGVVVPTNIVSRQTLHLVAHEDDTAASIAWLDAFDRGLLEIKRNGTYEQIRSLHTQRHRQEVDRLAAAAR